MKTLTVDDVRNMGGTFVNETLDIAFSIEGKVHNHQWDKKAVADIQVGDVIVGLTYPNRPTIFFDRLVAVLDNSYPVLKVTTTSGVTGHFALPLETEYVYTECLVTRILREKYNNPNAKAQEPISMSVTRLKVGDVFMILNRRKPKSTWILMSIESTDHSGLVFTLFDGYDFGRVTVNGTEYVELYTSLAHLLPKTKEQVLREEILSTLDADVHKAFDQLLEKHVELCKANKVSLV